MLFAKPSILHIHLGILELVALCSPVDLNQVLHLASDRRSDAIGLLPFCQAILAEISNDTSSEILPCIALYISTIPQDALDTALPEDLELLLKISVILYLSRIGMLTPGATRSCRYYDNLPSCRRAISF